MLSIYITYFSSICSCYQHTMCDKTKVHLSMLVNPVNHTYQNYYSRLAHILFPLGSIFTYQTDALPSSQKGTLILTTTQIPTNINESEARCSSSSPSSSTPSSSTSKVCLAFDVVRATGVLSNQGEKV